MPSPSTDTLQFPATRIGYAGINNPGFWADWVVADQAAQTAIIALLGVDLTTDFALLGGFAYSGGNYGPGWFYLNGKIYYQPTTFAEGLRLVPNITATNSQVFDDSVSRNTYNINYSQTGTGATQTPVFATGGDMDAYRYDNKSIKAGSNVQSWTVNSSPTFTGFINGTGSQTSAEFQYFKQGSICTLSFSIVLQIASASAGIQGSWDMDIAPIANADFSSNAVINVVGSYIYVNGWVNATNPGGTSPSLNITISSDILTPGYPKNVELRGQVTYRIS